MERPNIGRALAVAAIMGLASALPTGAQTRIRREIDALQAIYGALPADNRYSRRAFIGRARGRWSRRPGWKPKILRRLETLNGGR